MGKEKWNIHGKYIYRGLSLRKGMFKGRISKSIAIRVTGCSRNLNIPFSSFSPSFFVLLLEDYEREGCDRFYVNLDVNFVRKSSHSWSDTIDGNRLANNCNDFN